MKKFVLSLSLFVFFCANVWGQENNLSAKVKERAQKIYDDCIQIYEHNQKTTSDMIVRNIKINNCLEQAIKSEIKIGFSQKQQDKMIENLNRIRKSALAFYQTFHTENIYCDNSCGSMSSLFSYADEGQILYNILENLIYLNMKNNGH